MRNENNEFEDRGLKLTVTLLNSRGKMKARLTSCLRPYRAAGRAGLTTAPKLFFSRRSLK